MQEDDNSLIWYQLGNRFYTLRHRALGVDWCLVDDIDPEIKRKSVVMKVCGMTQTGPRYYMLYEEER